MAKGTKGRSPLPAELEGVAYAEDMTALQEKVDKCYSSERYESFQEAVEKIVERFLKGKVGWAIAIWIVSIVGSMLAQKFLKILGE